MLKTKIKTNKSGCKVELEFVPIDGDLNGYLSGRSTRTFHTPPSYGAVHKEGTQKHNKRTKLSADDRLLFASTSSSILRVFKWI